MQKSLKLLNHMIELLELDVECLEVQTADGLEAAGEMLPLVESELELYRKQRERLIISSGYECSVCGADYCNKHV